MPRIDRKAQAQDIWHVLVFTEQLLEFLLTLVPQIHQPEYRNVWNTEVKPTLLTVQQELLGLKASSRRWAKLDQVGWSPQSAHLKAEAIAQEAEEGALATTIHLTNSALGSLKFVFLGLEPPKEFKDFLEVWAKNRKEPEPYIQTLFPRGQPIPWTGR